jgi:hypothetical protein
MNIAPNKGQKLTPAGQEMMRQAMERSIAVYGRGDHTTQGFIPSLRKKRMFGVGLGFPWGNKYAFGLAQPAGNTARIYPGTVRHYGRNFITIAQTDKTLTGSASFVCVKYPLVGGSATLVVLNSEPDPLDSTDWYFPLYIFDQVAATSYRLRRPGGVRMGGHDIILGNPMP